MSIIMSYNIENMNSLFENNQIKPSCHQRALHIAEVISVINPHIIGICEAANTPQEHDYFINNYLPGMGYKVGFGASRGSQNLVFYFRDPFELQKIDPNVKKYDPWDEDIDSDGLKEHLQFERKPLEAVFKINGNQLIRIILVHTKSKGIFDVVDLQNYQQIALANRKRLIGQANRLRQRLNDLLNKANPLPTVVIGDMNDGPGLDPYERVLGKSFVETVMGSVFVPELIFHNTLWWMTKTTQTRNNLWTVEFPDPIVNNPLGYKHRVWLDHIIVSPGMLDQTNPVYYKLDSGNIGLKNDISRNASDHFPVYCEIDTN